MGMTEAVTSKTYDLWSWFYDYTFGALVTQRQKRAVEQVCLRLKPGQKVLDIGVGTGLTLKWYPREVDFVGMDLSAGMLAKAEVRRRELAMTHCRLVRGDAMLPPFAPASFDHVVMCHTISVVSEPARVLRWAARLLKPTGSLLLLNHFQSVNPVVGAVERWLNPMFMKIGWQSDVALEDLLRQTSLRVDYIHKVSLLDLWQIVALSPVESRAGSERDDRPAQETGLVLKPG